MAVELDGMSHSGFDTENLQECQRFYTEVLGARVEWTRARGGSDRATSMKIYVGDLGLSIGERAKDAPKIETPSAIRWAYRAEHEHVLEYIDYVKECGVAVEGPVEDRNEPRNVCWLFDDPDGHKLAIEAEFPTAEAAQAVVEQG